MTGPIDNPRTSAIDSEALTGALFDEKTRERLLRIAEEKQFSPVQLIREGTLRYLEAIENNEESPSPDSPQK